MKTRRSNRSTKGHFVFWTILAGSIAVAGAPWPNPGFSSLIQGDQTTRRTTDPPTRSRGKLGQDLFLAVDHRDEAAVQALLAKGADPDSRNGLEFTPLFIAAASHQRGVMEALLKAGAKPDTDTSYGTPLTFAAAGGHLEGVKLLLERGVDVNTARGDGTSVLMMAANAGSPEIAAELLKRKPDIEATDIHGSSALSLAARRGHDGIAKLLLEAGAKVDVIDREGQTPLMAAAMTGHAGLVQMLLAGGANPNAKDAKGRTPLILAASYGEYPEVVRLLLQGGAEPKLAASNGETAGAIAARHGYHSSAALLGSPVSGARKIANTAVKAIPRSLKLIQESMGKFNAMTACISCHQEGLGRIAVGEAALKGYKPDPEVKKALEERINGALNALRPLHEKALEDPETMKQVPLIEMNETSTGYSWLMAGMAAQHDPGSPGAAAMAKVLARQQAPAGFWSFSLPRVPMQSSFFTFTALSIKAIQTYMPKADAAEVADRVRRAKAWLLEAPAKTSEDRASRLLGLKWAGASSKEMRKAIDEVLKDQHPDGGWAQVDGMHSDAYATGQALYALHYAGGLAVKNPVYEKGVQFLLRTQDDDGSWFVNKRAMAANNYFDAGFPHGQSQYASFNGTCWATMALLATVGTKG